MGNFTEYDRPQIAAAYRDLAAENEKLKPLSDAVLPITQKFLSNPSGGYTDEERAALRRGTEATQQRTANTTLMIEINNELAFRGEAALSPQEKGE